MHLLGMAYDPLAIRTIRIDLGLSQRELAEEIGVAPSNVSRWESGLTKPRGPAVKLLRALSRKAARKSPKPDVAPPSLPKTRGSNAGVAA